MYKVPDVIPVFLVTLIAGYYLRTHDTEKK
jgi:hypothetical protein